MSRATCNGERYDIDGSIKSCFMLRRLTAALCLLYATKAFTRMLCKRATGYSRLTVNQAIGSMLDLSRATVMTVTTEKMSM